METLEKQISDLGEARSTCLPADSPASPSASQDSARERRMTAISSLRCFVPYPKSDPLGSLARTLLESLRWYNPAVRLRWQQKVICSERVTYTEKISTMSSTTSSVRLNVLDMKSSRSLFRLVPSEHRTVGREYGLLPTVQTQGLKENIMGKSQPVLPALLPTPTAIDRGTGRVNRSLGKNAKDRPTLARLVRENIPKKDGEIFQLSPLYVADMMGFPLMWTVSPFLIPDGEPNP